MRNKREQIRRAIVFLLAVASLIICAAPSLTSSGLAYAQATAPTWTNTSSLNTPRSGYTATLLPNGKVLVTGGSNADGILASAELYDPSTGTWSPTGNLNAPHIYHSATLLQNGKVLIAGGGANSCCLEVPDNTAELYDPATGLWSLTGNLNARRFAHTATLLSNGTVLFAGGLGGGFSATSSAELYNPGTGTWSFTGNLLGPRVGHAATLLQGGKVLVVGGCADADCGFELGSAELYDPNTGAWTSTGGLSTSRYAGFTTTVLLNGNVLLAGGVCCFSNGGLNNAHLYNPATGQWSDTGNLLGGRFGATATLLPSGQVLVAAGVNYGHDDDPGAFNSAELYDPATGNWRVTASLNKERFGHTATLLLNGKVLVVGGYGAGYNDPLQSAELYDSGSGSTINPIDDPQFFVRQQYLDFLSREPDGGGLAYWTNEITQCGKDTACIHRRRIGVSAAFFIEQEFQETGYFVYRFYKASFNRPPNYTEFTSDRSRVMDGSSGEASKQVFADEWVQRPAFVAAYPTTMSNTEVVNKLFDSAGLTASRYDPLRQQEILAMNAGRSRALVLRDVIEIPDFKTVPNPNDPRYSELKQLSQYNPAFVLMQYFGYLGRNVDSAGYAFWLDVVNNREPNNYRGMVCAFITSTEYQLRFGSAVTRSNADCGQ